MNWSGLYIGASIGAIDGNIEHNHYSETVAPGPFVLNPGFEEGVMGGHVGIQHQFHGGLIVGVEAGVSGNGPFSGWKANQACPLPIATDTSCNQSMKTLYTIGPRIGWGFNNYMVYATGGFASGTLNSRYTVISTGLDRFAGFSGTSRNNGWFIGGGFEWALTSNWIIGLEYQHFDLGSERATKQLAVNDNDNIALAADGDIVRFRLSYKLGRDDHKAADPMK